MRKSHMLSTAISVVVTIVIIGVLYYLVTMPKHSETYTYHVKAFDNTSKIEVIENDRNVYVNHIYADLYNVQKEKVGQMYSVNHHRKIDDTNHVTTLSTYITPNGTFTCNYYYSAPLDENYFYGTMKHVVSENETGKYSGNKINVMLEGKRDGTRVLQVTY